jgi:dTDP-4-amino-4,6-dideoxygalactose transaminase
MNPTRLYKPYISEEAKTYIADVLESASIGSGGIFTQRCMDWFLQHYSATSVFFTSSCTDALEMSALVLKLKPGDEVILPSYTFVSTANAFYLRGAVLRFADCNSLNPNITIETIQPLYNSKTKAIIIMHYAGISVDLDPILEFARDKGLFVIEDAAQAIGSLYNGRYLGTLTDIGCISFHETKLLSCGEGGVCVVNNQELQPYAECVFEKGTNKMAFQRREVNKYEWVSPGSSFGMSELQAALLYSQLETFYNQLEHRKKIWNFYMLSLSDLSVRNYLELPFVPDFAEINGTHFYIVLPDITIREGLINYLKEHQIESAFHYLSLHKSPFFKNRDNQNLPMTEKYESCLLRLPLHCEINENTVLRITDLIKKYLTTK